jgi:hypothetical protein
MPDRPLTCDPLALASHLAEITVIYHHTWLKFFAFKKMVWNCMGAYALIFEDMTLN